MNGGGDVFPGTAEVLLHLGNDRFSSRIYDRTVTGDAAFVAVELGGGVKIVTRYPEDLLRLAARMIEVADELEKTHLGGGTSKGQAPSAGRLAHPEDGTQSVLNGQSVLL